MTTIQGIRSLFQQDTTIDEAKKSFDKVNDPWLQGFVFRSYDSTTTKVKKFFKSFLTLGLAPYTALIHDLIVFDKTTLGRKVQTAFEDIKKNIQQDRERMTIKSSDPNVTMSDLVREVYKSFNGSTTKTALFLRTIGQGPANRLKDLYVQQTEAILSTDDSQYSTVTFDVARRTATVVGYFIRSDPPTGRETTMKTYNVTIEATFDFDKDTIDYHFETYDPEMSAKAFEYRYD